MFEVYCPVIAAAARLITTNTVQVIEIVMNIAAAGTTFTTINATFVIMKMVVLAFFEPSV